MMARFISSSKHVWTTIILVASTALVALAMVSTQAAAIVGIALAAFLPILFLTYGNILATMPVSVRHSAKATRVHSDHPRPAKVSKLQPRHILAPNGEVQQAWAVPAQSHNGYHLMLTTEGYVVTDETGRIIRGL